MTRAPLEPGQVLTGVGFVAAAMAFGVIWLGIPAVFLSFGLIISLALWLFSPWQVNTGVRLWFAVGISVFALHVGEEFLAGFYERFPALFAREWTASQFVAFNVVWFVVFAVAAASTRQAKPLAMLVVLFFMVTGGIGNGVAHLVLWIQDGRYFPGGWTAPLCLLVGGALLRAIYRPPAIAAGNSPPPPGQTPG